MRNLSLSLSLFPVLLLNCKFYNCNIKNITFRNCSFSGSKFKDIKFQNVIFEECIFSAPIIEKDHHEVDDLYYAPTIFEKCIFVSNFLNCDIDNALFELSNFTLTKFQESSLQHSIMNKCAIAGMEMKDCDLKDLSIVNTDIMDISFNDNLSTSVDENTFIDYRIKTKRKNIGKRNDSGWKSNSYDDMCMDKSKTIKSFAKLFAKNGYSDIEGEYFYSSKRIELKALHGIDKFKSISALVLCGYGERPSFTFLTILVSSLLFAIIYMFSGVNAGGESIKYSLIGGEQMPAIKVICDYGKCLFFSITTFSTVGYGNYVPLGICSMFVSGLHMFVGVSLCALWTGCIFRKISR